MSDIVRGRRQLYAKIKFCKHAMQRTSLFLSVFQPPKLDKARFESPLFYFSANKSTEVFYHTFFKLQKITFPNRNSSLF